MKTPMEQMRNPPEAASALRVALAERRFATAIWWGYSVSHHTFMLLLGELSENLVVVVYGCNQLSGPPYWQGPSVQVEVHDNPRRIVFSDVRVGFRVEAQGPFYWGRDMDPISGENLWFRWGNAPPDAPLIVETQSVDRT